MNYEKTSSCIPFTFSLKSRNSEYFRLNMTEESIEKLDDAEESKSKKAGCMLVWIWEL